MQKVTHALQVKQHFASLYGKATINQIKRYNKLIANFKKQFGQRECYLASSSGRVEIVGNHTDHNGGLVVGCTVSLDIASAFLPNQTGKVTIISNGYKPIKFSVEDIDNTESGSTAMAKGVLKGLANSGYKIGGFDAVINSILPSGAGISSSASFQLLVATIQNHLYNDGQIPAPVLAEVGQFAENVYFKKPCGLLDQGVIAVGGVVAMDFSNGFSFQSVPCNFQGYNLVLVNTGGSHANLTSHYSAIPAEMKAVANCFGKQRLIEVDEQEFFLQQQSLQQKLGLRPVLRAKHFFQENKRVQAVQQALSCGNMQQFVDVVNDSGNSSLHQLQNCSVGTGDTVIADAIAFAKSICPTCASRVHGGGFAGTILNVVPKQHVANFVENMANRYGKDNVFVLNVRTVGATVL
ncbi:MAG: galactokinase [Clostridia bacterium]|nr:galactokinase [Clostridia bacterium]